MSTTLLEALPDSILRLLQARGLESEADRTAFLSPCLARLSPADSFADMPAAVARLRRAIDGGEMIALYADRDMDGLAGLTVLWRSLRALGARVTWDGPGGGRGIDPEALQRLRGQGARLLVFIDCGGGESETLQTLAREGIEVIVADHHRLSAERPPALAWIHPHFASSPQGNDGYEKPAGCVMAFKLAEGLWRSFLGPDDAERLDYFLYEHLDVVALGILADRVPLRGENRTLVWHGLRRLATTRKTGLAALLRFARLTPRRGPITVREATWRLIPLLNAAGRLGEPQWTADLLCTEDAWTARVCIDRLIALNSERRAAQDHSVATFQKSVEDQCALDRDPVLVALAAGLKPTVTGLAAQALARQYGRPAALFVEQGDEAVGSVRGIEANDLFAWVESHKSLLVRFGGHEGAVGLTVRRSDFDELRRRLIDSAASWTSAASQRRGVPDIDVTLAETSSQAWWDALRQMEPFGPGNPEPLMALRGVARLEPLNRRRVRGFRLHTGVCAWPAEWDGGVAPEGTGPWTVTATPQALRQGDFPYQWIIQDVHAEQRSAG